MTEHHEPIPFTDMQRGQIYQVCVNGRFELVQIIKCVTAAKQLRVKFVQQPVVPTYVTIVCAHTFKDVEFNNSDNTFTVPVNALVAIDNATLKEAYRTLFYRITAPLEREERRNLHTIFAVACNVDDWETILDEL